LACRTVLAPRPFTLTLAVPVLAVLTRN
jgi:hypothetical protein